MSSAPVSPFSVVSGCVGSTAGSAAGSWVGSAAGSCVGSTAGSCVGSVAGSCVGSAAGSCCGSCAAAASAATSVAPAPAFSAAIALMLFIGMQAETVRIADIRIAVICFLFIITSLYGFNSPVAPGALITEFIVHLLYHLRMNSAPHKRIVFAYYMKSK